MQTPKPRGRGVSGVETVALGIVLVALTFLATRRLDQSLSRDLVAQALEERYDSKNSQHEEEWIIRDFFADRRNGVFLDVGASHYRDHSNTYFLETALGWSGIAVDAIAEFADDYARHRPNTRFVAMFASEVADSSVRFFVAPNALVSSSDPEFTRRYGREGTPRQVPTTTLDAVLDQFAIQQIDFLSMDIELAEPKALAGFDVRRFRPDLVCIEGHPEVRQQILDYFARYGYVLVGRYLRADKANLYFTPLAEDTGSRPSPDVKQSSQSRFHP